MITEGNRPRVFYDHEEGKVPMVRDKVCLQQWHMSANCVTELESETWLVLQETTAMFKGAHWLLQPSAAACGRHNVDYVLGPYI